MKRLTILLLVSLASIAHAATNQRAVITEFADFLAIPNLASDAPNIARNAAAIQAMFEKRGASTRLLTLDGAPPIVVVDIPAPGATRTIAFYAHYDGQPVDLKQWQGAPWTPVMRDAAGNTAFCSFKVTIKDVVAPAFSCKNIVVPFSGSPLLNKCQTRVDYPLPEVTEKSCSIGPSNGLSNMGTYNGHTYFQSSSNKTWWEARREAEALGAHLVTIGSSGENEFVNTHLFQNSSQMFFWIGGFQNVANMSGGMSVMKDNSCVK